jgi:dienelactone hydrolase
MMFYDNKCYKELADRLCVKYALRDSQVKAMLSSEDAKACLDYCNRMKTAMKDRLKPVTEVEGEIKLVSSKIINFFRVENVIFQGKNGECIPINVYSPLDDSKKYPAVVVSVGHWREGKRLEVNQRLCQHLCAEGMVVAIYDPMYQGERNPYTDQMLERMFPGVSEDIQMVNLHMQSGNACYLLGDNLGEFFLWDSMRVVDYLLTRNDVDPERIAATGQSGGGTQSVYLAACDDRVTCYSPIQSITKERLTITGSGIGDCEQSMMGISEDDGFDYPDMLWGAYPAQCMINAARKDFFGIEGVYEVNDELATLYNLLGKNRFHTRYSNGEHWLDEEARNIECDFLCNALLGRDSEKDESDFVLLSEDELKCFTDCETRVSQKFALRNRLDNIKLLRPKDDSKARSELIKLIEKSRESRGNCETHFATRDSNKLIVVLTGRSLWDKFSNNVDDTLFVMPMGAEEGIEKQRNKIAGYDVVTGIFNEAVVLGEGYASSIAAQVIDAVEKAESERKHSHITLVAEGAMTTAALLVGAVTRINKTVLIDPIQSLESLFTDEMHNISEAAMEPGLMKIADIPELKKLNMSVEYTTVQNSILV